MSESSSSRMDIEPTTTMATAVDPAGAGAASVVDPEIFESVQRQIDEDMQLRDVCLPLFYSVPPPPPGGGWAGGVAG